jgi:N-acetylmuramoyl-L-alanine amidase
MKTGVNMVRQLGLIAFAAFMAASADAAPTVRTMYTDAAAQEQAVREALADPAATDVVLKAVRTVIAAYEAVVRRYPNSSYSDNALWQAGRLALDAFGRFGQQNEQVSAERLLKMLQAEYPASKLARMVPAELSKKVRPLQQSPQVIPASTEPTSAVKPQSAPSRTAGATIMGIRRIVTAEGVRLVIEIDKEMPFHEERISGPARIFVDFEATRTAPSLVDQTLRFDGDADIIRQVRIGRHPNATRVVLDATGVSSYSVYPLYSPYRLIVDCVRASAGANAQAADSAIVADRATNLRQETKPALGDRAVGGLWSRRTPSVTPLATSAIANAVVKPTLEGRNLASAVGNRLPSVTASGTGALTEALTSQTLAGRALSDGLARRLPVVWPTGRSALAGATPVESERAIASAPSPATPERKKPGSEYSMARQLGLGVSRIVIDAGHGGHDPGAQARGITEAELVLDIAQRLQRLLGEVSGLEVIMTRVSDEFLPLQERTAIANREGADLFLSIHGNASDNSQARGIETYFLNFASTLTAAQVAARENAASGQAMGALPDFVKAIALNNKVAESRDFATLVQNAMVERLRPTNKTLRNLGVKEAPFVVLIGASMPSVLVEISFLTNPQEARLLKSDTYRQRIAEALFNGIRKYQRSLTNVQRVAHH